MSVLMMLTSRTQVRRADDVVCESGTGAAIPRCPQRFVRRLVHILNAIKAKMLAQVKDVTVGSGVGSRGVAVIANNGSSEPSNPGIFQLSLPVKAEEVVQLKFMSNCASSG